MVAVVAVSAAAAFAPAQAPLPPSGIRGLVESGGCAGPTGPTGGGCHFSPASAEVRVLRARDGREMARFRSREDGRFRVRLRRGRYLLDPLEGEAGLHKGTVAVRVERGRFTRVRIVYDNGVR